MKLLNLSIGKQRKRKKNIFDESNDPDHKFDSNFKINRFYVICVTVV